MKVEIWKGTDIWDGFVTGGDPRSGPVAVGGDLEPATLVGAYRHGLFPWPPSDKRILERLMSEHGSDVASGAIPNVTPGGPATLDIPWWSPDPRGVIFVNDLRIPKHVRRRLSRVTWTTTIDVCFLEVMRRCRRPGEVSWIGSEIIEAYLRLHRLGIAHSVEVWNGDELIAGLYGLLIGGIFAGESMFRTVDHSSKIALIDIVIRLGDAGGTLFDSQFPVAHFTRFGAKQVARERYLQLLHEYRDDSITLPIDHRVVASYRQRWDAQDRSADQGGRGT